MVRVAACLVAVLWLAGCGGGAVQGGPGAPVADAGRGRLLYDTHCNACHTAQAHWRDRRIVRSWQTLVGEVTRWQRNSGLAWTEAEINDVAAYLNGVYYRLECDVPGCGGGASTAGL